MDSLLPVDFISPELIVDFFPLVFGAVAFAIMLRLVLGTIEGLCSSIRVMTTGFINND